jgi:ATP-dependent RNA helicase RhlE
MFRKNYDRPSRGSRPMQRPSFNRGGSRPNYRQGGGRRRFVGQHIDVSKFINKAVVTEEAVFKPENFFSDFAVDERIKENIKRKGYVTPSPIQDKAIPHVLKGADIVGIANTGTGKTAAFLIPLIDKVLKNKSEKIIIAAPTRELAQQIDEELKEFARGLGMYSVCVVGGAPIGRQISGLRMAHNFVIGTPGRIKDLVERKVLNLSLFKTVVLDEADRMLDMGFVADMRYMMAKMAKDRHTLFFSATMSREIENLIKEFLNNPISISVRTSDTAKTVDQDIVRIVSGKTKADTLHELLLTEGFGKVLVFTETKHGAEWLSKELIARGFKSESIHGNKNQSQRQRALGSFKDNRTQVLVATDVAARGIDVSDISHVINYDIPHTYQDYVHRIGRTGRAGKSGKALTFIE